MAYPIIFLMMIWEMFYYLHISEQWIYYELNFSVFFVQEHRYIILFLLVCCVLLFVNFFFLIWYRCALVYHYSIADWLSNEVNGKFFWKFMGRLGYYQNYVRKDKVVFIYLIFCCGSWPVFICIWMKGL